MAKRDDFIYVTSDEAGDDTYVYDEPSSPRRSLTSKAASVAVLASGIALGVAFNPAAAIFAQSSSDEAKLEPSLTPANLLDSSGQSPDSTIFSPQSFANEPFSGSTGNAYQVPAQQFAAGTGTPSFGNLSSARPTGAGAWSDDDNDDDDDHEDRDHNEDRDKDDD